MRTGRATTIGAVFAFGVVIMTSVDIRADNPSITPTDGIGDLGTRISESGAVHTITGGTRPDSGGNLFHSFGRFSIGADSTADFVNDSGLATDNIVSRVSGGVRSDIQGAIKTTGFTGTNLYLINPAGVLFGPNASLNVSGSFHASTADYLKLGSDGVFYADPSRASTLSTASPSAFGFLGDNPAGISVDGAYLRVPTDQDISLVGGDVRIDSGGSYSLRAARGTVSIASVASAGEWKPTAPDLGMGSFEKLGKVAIRNKARISTSGGSAGTVRIRGGRFELDDSSLYSSTRTSNATHVGIDIAVTEDAVIRNGSQILANASTNVDGADIRVSAGSRVEVDDATIQTVSSQTSLAGRGGDVSVSGKTVVAGNRAHIEAITVHGPGGDLGITTENLEIRSGATVRTTTFGAGNSGALAVEAAQSVLLTSKNEDGATCNCTTGLHSRGAFGDGGTVTVTAKQVEVRDGAGISVSSRRSGQGGSVEVTADRVTIEGLGPTGSRSGLYSQSNDSRATGNAGDVTVRADVLEVQNGGQISVAALGPGDGGNLSIEAKNIEITGVAAGKSARLNANTEAAGQGGTIHIRAEGLDLTDGGQILASAFKTGNSGSVEIGGQPVSVLIEANDVLIEGVSEGRSARIVASTAGPSRAGDVIIRTNTLVARDGGDVSAFSEGEGTAGMIEVTAESILLDGGNYPRLSTGFRAGAFANGQAGTLKIATGRLEVHNGALISSSSWGDHAAGSIDVSADQILISAANVRVDSLATGLAAAAEGDGAGGSIRIGPRDSGLMLEIRDGGSIQSGVAGSGAGGDIEVQAEQVLIGGVGPFGLPGYMFAGTTAGGKGGNINVRARALQLNEQGVITTATWGTGQGGDTLVMAELLRMSGGASISADSHDSGNAGSIGILTETTDLSTEAKISSSAFDSGDASAVELTASGTLSIAGSDTGVYSETEGSGDAGNLVISAAALLMDEGSISARTGGTGSGGAIAVRAGTVSLQNGTTIDSSTDGSGAAGNILLESDTLAMRSGAGITTGSSGSAPGGEIEIDVAGPVSFTGRGRAGRSTGVYSNSEAAGSGGGISIQAHDLFLAAGASISTESTGAGDAGNIFVNAVNKVVLEDGADITTAAVHADGGNIEVWAQQMLYLLDSTITSTVKSGEGGGGNILIDPEFVILNRSRINANAFGGPGGNIHIVAGNFTKSADSVVEASSERSIDGQVVIESAESDISGEVVMLPESFLDASNLLKGHCSAARAGSSSLIVGGRGSMPTQPDAYLPSFSFDETEVEGIESAALNSGSHSFVESVKRVTDQALASGLTCS